MQFQPFYIKIREYRSIFNLADLKVIFPDDKITSLQLSRWQIQGYLIKLKRGLYVLDTYKDTVHNFLIANLLYYPSYISLEIALYEYSFIPDVPQTITSLTTQKTWATDVLSVRYDYKKIKTDCFVGYGAQKYLGYDVLMAEPEKALVDFLYFNKSRIKNDEQIRELRLNYDNLKQRINKETIRHYSLLFKSPALNSLLNKILAKF